MGGFPRISSVSDWVSGMGERWTGRRLWVRVGTIHSKIVQSLVVKKVWSWDEPVKTEKSVDGGGEGHCERFYDDKDETSQAAMRRTNDAEETV